MRGRGSHIPTGHTATNTLSGIYLKLKYSYSSSDSCVFQLHHYGDVSAEVRREVGQTQDEFVEYMLGKFPGLVLFVWMAASERRQLENLRDYFPHDFQLR